MRHIAVLLAAKQLLKMKDGLVAESADFRQGEEDLALDVDKKQQRSIKTEIAHILYHANVLIESVSDQNGDERYIQEKAKKIINNFFDKTNLLKTGVAPELLFVHLLYGHFYKNGRMVTVSARLQIFCDVEWVHTVFGSLESTTNYTRDDFINYCNVVEVMLKGVF